MGKHIKRCIYELVSRIEYKCITYKNEVIHINESSSMYIVKFIFVYV